MEDREQLLIQPSGSNYVTNDPTRSDDITADVDDEPYFAGVEFILFKNSFNNLGYYVLDTTKDK